MLKKRNFKKEKVTKVTFTAPVDAGAERVELWGSFNNWQAPVPLTKQKDGSFRTTLDIPPGTECEFRYRVNDDYWMNDPECDGTRRNPFGGENSVVNT